MRHCAPLVQAQWRMRPQLVPYAGPFDGFHNVTASVSKTCTVRFDNNRYSVIRNGTRDRFFNVVDLVNRLEAETRGGKQGRMADDLTRLDFVIPDELG